MRKGNIIAWTVIGLSVFMVAWTIAMFFSYQNTAISLENRFEASEKKARGTFDNMWKIIEGKAGVSTQYKNAFIETIRAQVGGRQGGEIAKFIHEAAPGLSPELYRDVSNAIEAQRTVFLNTEVELLAIRQQHKDIIQQFPGSLFLGGRKQLEYEMITSGRTNTAFETKTDESDPDPFHKINSN